MEKQVVKKQVKIHFLAFNPPDDYGKMILRVNVSSEDSPPEEAAEEAFQALNAPNRRPDIVVKEGKCYSLSVGDVVETDPDTFMLCRFVGFKKLDKEEFGKLISPRRQGRVGIMGTLE